eukprot:CAMPEP_0169428486 /NCGR_PEP_ID=MMETSP1042-20121227/1352_1 /TAXON_ID=464988 /ORGANISM="Hemiselmis andersenii, Strain CCMP1180" /LENGTH=151 /DNA_ID=CAMNT_0009538659 /DNA_START=242 /DNA_END=697 /DNA_ORIENTATION=-
MMRSAHLLYTLSSWCHGSGMSLPIVSTRPATSGATCPIHALCRSVTQKMYLAASRSDADSSLLRCEAMWTPCRFIAATPLALAGEPGGSYSSVSPPERTSHPVASVSFASGTRKRSANLRLREGGENRDRERGVGGVGEAAGGGGGEGAGK